MNVFEAELIEQSHDQGGGKSVTSPDCIHNLQLLPRAVRPIATLIQQAATLSPREGHEQQIKSPGQLLDFLAYASIQSKDRRKSGQLAIAKFEHIGRGQRALQYFQTVESLAQVDVKDAQ